MSLSQRWASLSTMWKAVFRDHEIFIRTGGEVRFIRLSAVLQRRVAALVLGALGLWLAFTIGMILWQASATYQQRDVAARAVAVERAEARVATEAERMAAQVRSLGARQDYLEGVLAADFDNAPPAPTNPTETATSDAATPVPSDRISALHAIGERQSRLVVAMISAIDARSQRAETALAAVGIRAGSTEGQGGPFIPASRHEAAAPRDPAFQRLAQAVARMELVEQLVLSLPSSLPAEGMNLSSGFGYRRDPFNGSGAMHAGLDFKGAHASPIRAAAAGRVAFVGRQSGYGNTIEIDHGHGIMTRYAHMSGFVTRVGQTVTPGTQIGLMGSTGRSTGTHLHFEVRVNGSAVNPRRFLEANPDVLEVQASVSQRVHSRGNAR
ncbi:MAG: M23 family metallopeptidase [Pseudomonadota bacterium]